MQSLENRDLIALFSKVARAGKSRRTRAYNRNLMTVRGGHFYIFGGMFIMPVGDKALQSADTYRLALNSANTL